MRKSKLKLISLLLEDIVNRLNSQSDYDIFEEEISEVLDWLFIREKGSKDKIMEIVFQEFQSYRDNKFFDDKTLDCINHLYKFTRKQVSKHLSFNDLDEDEQESIFESTKDCLVIKENIEFNKKKGRKEDYVIVMKKELIYNYKRLKELKSNPNVKIGQWFPGIPGNINNAGCLGTVVYKIKKRKEK